MKFGFHTKSHIRSSSKKLFFGLLVFFLIIAGSIVLSFENIDYQRAFGSSGIQPVTENFVHPYEDKVLSRIQPLERIGFLPYWNVIQKKKVHHEYLTQLIYFGIPMNETGRLVKMNADGVQTLEWSTLISEDLKNIQNDANETDTKFLVAITNFDNKSIDNLVSNPSATTSAIADLDRLINDRELDGINFNFEYFTDSEFPTLPNLNRFLQSVTEDLKKRHPDLIISFDVNATAVYNDNAYDMVKIGETVDQIIIMGYDFHRAGSLYSGHIAPLYAEEDKPSLDKSIQSLKGRIPDSKLVLALPLYGYEWQTLTDGQYSRTVPDTGALATYGRVRDLIDHNDTVELHYDEKAESPWLLYNQNGLIKQVYYENELSLKKKSEYIVENNLGGIGFWAVGYEAEYIEPWRVIHDVLR